MTDIGNAVGYIRLDASGVTAGIQQAQAQLQGMKSSLSQSLQATGQQMQSLGGSLTMAFAPVTGFVAKSMGGFIKFDDVLTEIQARTGATDAEMAQVRSTALQMGQDTAFSATDAAESMLQLLSSGYDLKQTFQSLPAVLDAAAAGGMNLGSTADAVTDVLALFGLKATDAARVSNVLTQASGASSATMMDLVQGMSNVGGIAKQFGLSVEDTSAILAVFAENGIKGAEGGTQLRSMLTQLTSGTEKTEGALQSLGVSLTDSSGNFRPLNDVIKDLNHAMNDTRTVTYKVNNVSAENKTRLDEAQKAYASATRQILLYQDGLTTGSLDQEKAGKKLQQYQQVAANAAGVIAEITGNQEDAQYITRTLTRTQEQNFKAIKDLAGSYGQIGLSALIANDGFDGMLDLMSQQATAAEVGAARMRSLRGVFEQLGSTVETIGINVFAPFADRFLKPMLNAFVGVGNAINAFIAKNETIATVLGTVLVVLAVIGPAIWYFGSALVAAGALLGVLGSAVGFLLSPLTLLAALLVGVYLAISSNFLGIRDLLAPILEPFDLLYQGIKKTFDLLESGRNIFQSLRSGIGFFVDDIARAMGFSDEQVLKFSQGFQTLVDYLEGFYILGKGIRNTFKAIFDGVNVFDALRGRLGLLLDDALKAAFGLPADKAQMIAVQFQKAVTVLEGGYELTKQIASGQATIFDGLRQGLGGVIDDLVLMAGGSQDLANRLQGNFIRAINGLEAGFTLLQTGAQGLWNSITRVTDAFQTGGLREAAQVALDELSTGLQNAGGAVWDFLRDSYPAVRAAVTGVFNRLIADIPGLLSRLQGAGGSLLTSLLQGAGDIRATLEPLVNELIAALGEFIPQAATQLAAQGNALWSWLEDTLPGLAEQAGVLIGQALEVFVPALIDFLGNLGATLVQYAPLVLGGMLYLTYLVGNWIVNTAVPELLTLAARVAEGFINGLIEGITGQSVNLSASLAGLLGVLQEGFNAWGAIKDMALALIPALIDWVLAAVPGITANLITLGQVILDWVAGKATELGVQVGAWATTLSEWVNAAIPTLTLYLALLWLGVNTWLSGKLSELQTAVLEWGGAIVQWVLDAIPTLTLNLVMFWLGVTTWLSTKVTELQTAAGEWATAVAQWALDAIPALTLNLLMLWLGVTTWLTDKTTELTTTFAGWGTAVTDWITNAIPTVSTKLGEVWTAIKSWIDIKTVELIFAMAALTPNLYNWITNAIETVKTKLGEVKDAVTSKVGEIEAEAVSMGENIIQGLYDGIVAKFNQMKSQFESVFSDIINMGAGVLGIKSPSTVFRELGNYVMEGLNLGLQDNQAVLETMRAAAQAVTAPFENLPDALPPLIPQTTGNPGGAGAGEKKEIHIHIDPSVLTGSLDDLEAKGVLLGQTIQRQLAMQS